jgi:hypothetical protein
MDDKLQTIENMNTGNVTVIRVVKGGTMKRSTIIILGVSLMLAFGCATVGADVMKSDAKMTQHYESSIFKVTDGGKFSLEILLPEKGLELGVNKVDIIIHNARDKDVTKAKLTVKPWMRAMGHGTKEQVVISEKGGGLYTVSNINFSMTGKWELQVDVREGKVSDKAIIELPVVGAMGHTSMMKAPDASMIDQAASKMSRDGLYQISYESRVDPVPVNRIHSWSITVKTKDGKPVENAKIKIAGDMPEHGHGFPTEPEVTGYLGEGKYLVEGIKFSMPGWWVVEFHVMAGGKMDNAGFNLVVK